MNRNDPAPEPLVVLPIDECVIKQEEAGEDLRVTANNKNGRNGAEAVQVTLQHELADEDEEQDEDDNVEEVDEAYEVDELQEVDNVSAEPPAKKSRSSEELDIRFLISSKVSLQHYCNCIAN